MNDLVDTTHWLRTLEDVAEKLRQYAKTADDQGGLECVRRALDQIEYLQESERRLPEMHATMSALTQRGPRPEESEIDALRKFQEALVQVARAVIHIQTVDSGAFDGACLPPYDQWLPFKAGIGVH